ncbi:L-2-hydroxyglutarate oxidase [Deinococcus irradiatisoli]|uniref:L-2-hydroxyglutarate oxidase n=2 Tax=Deinococcus irradiatisoli TaxID=2202254 RepID=A0A2Z3JH29_9DEIO|nr:L-2-hydroxyglutarate oxidase [Deinococcus irradiatisoli]
MVEADVAVVGAGLVGLATARAIRTHYPRLSVALLDKEAGVAAHQSGHNSGVIHAGLYYKPGSLKARLCLSGRQQLERYCTEHGVKFERCGKLVVAADAEEEGRLLALAHRALQNGIHVRLLSPEQMKEHEPHVAGVAALHSPETGIADYPGLAKALKAELLSLGTRVLHHAELRSVTRRGEHQVLHTTAGEVQARWTVTCAGLQADKVARLCGAQPDVQIVPFRGEYYDLKPERAGLVRNLIYPVPDPRFPFLGVHLTRMIGGGVEAGPNAVLAFAREGYRRRDVHPGELFEALSYPGFWRLAARYPNVGTYEMYRSLSKREFARSLQRLVPELTADDLTPGGSGVRAQALNRAGQIVDDFAVLETPSALHVLNAPSPAATACLAIGEHLSQLAARNFGWAADPPRFVRPSA